MEMITSTINHDSSLLKTSVYRIENHTLEITFQNGARYIYKDVDYETYMEFTAAESQGTFFGKNIRKKYEYEKIEEDGDKKSE